MHVVTETEVRNLARRIPAGGQLTVPRGSIVTPLARDYLRSRNVDLAEDAATPSPPGRGPSERSESGVREETPAVLAPSAESQLINAVADEVARILQNENAPSAQRTEVEPPRESKTPVRAVVWAIGGDRPGLLAAVAELLGRHKINILEISQTILSGVFAMVVIVDVASTTTPFGDLKRELEALGQKLGINLSTQRDDIFQYMHRI
jgi:ACT domain-containing protein